MKNILLGILFFGFGSIFSLLFFFYKNYTHSEQTFIFESKINHQETNFSLEKAPLDSIKGQIVEMSGEVLQQSRIATEPAKLLPLTQIQQGEELFVGEKGKLIVKFASTSAMTLSPKTEVGIIQTLPINLVFNQTKGLTQYEAFGISPVSIRSLNMLTTLNNGIIDVFINDKTGKITLTLKKGTAIVAYNNPSFESQVWDLEKGDVFIYDSNKRKGYFEDSL